jgi:hypothetical protein
MDDEIFEGVEQVEALTREMARLDHVTSQFGRSLSRALASGIVQGKSFDDLLRGLGERLIGISLQAAFRPLEASLTSGISSLFGSLTGALSGGSSGLFGDLGAGSSGGGLFGALSASAGSSVTVNMAVTSPDAASFNRSEAQISATLARAVSRGRRGL